MMQGLRMEELMVYTITLSVVIWCLECATVDGGKVLGPIYWNTSNSMFKTNKESRIDVDIDDKLDIICPRRGRDDGEQHFYFKLYLVNAENYRKCNSTGGKRLITCDVPSREKKYTFYFQEISPSPWGLEFEPEQSYYVISTSDGTERGIGGMIGGVCTRYNMKLEMRVHKKQEEKTDGGSNRRPTKPVFPNPPPNRKPETPDGSVLPPTGQKPIIRNKNPHADGNPGTRNEGGGGGGGIDSGAGAGGGIHNSGNDGGGGGGDDSTVDSIDTAGESSNGMWVGIILGACAVLFILFLAFLAYKIYRKRRNMKKYQSSPISPARPGDPMSQVTLMPISAAPRHHSASAAGTGPPHHTRLVSDHDTRHHGTHVGDMRPPPSYNESFLDNGGSIVAV